MTDILLFLIIVLLVAVFTALLALLRKGNAAPAGLEKQLERAENSFKDEFSRNRSEVNLTAKNTREELNSSLKNYFDTFSSQFRALSEATGQKLEKMRETVDEKMQVTLEKRLGESFKTVNDTLEQVHRGLGEMQTLASDVGDLKKVLSNVKTKGIMGEYQLGNLLEQVLAPEQYAENIATKKDSNDRVEFAIKFPGSRKGEHPTWLPIDSKFPLESYSILIDASEKGDTEGIKEAGTRLERNIKNFAKDISSKYIDPPNTTDFAVMFLPIEGLYAEVLRNPGLLDTLRRDYHVVISGPTTLAAFLSSLQMGFKTLAIEKRSSEIWKTLGAVKTEFGKFAEILEDVSKRLDQAAKTIDKAKGKSKTINRKLKSVEELPAGESDKLLEE